MGQAPHRASEQVECELRMPGSWPCRNPLHPSSVCPGALEGSDISQEPEMGAFASSLATASHVLVYAFITLRSVQTGQIPSVSLDKYTWWCGGRSR